MDRIQRTGFLQKEGMKFSFSSGVFQKGIEKRTPPTRHTLGCDPRGLPRRSGTQHVLANQVVPLLVLQDNRFQFLPAFVDQDVDDSRVGDGRPRLKEVGDVAAELCGRCHVLEAVVFHGPGDEAADLSLVGRGESEKEREGEQTGKREDEVEVDRCFFGC